MTNGRTSKNWFQPDVDGFNRISAKVCCELCPGPKGDSRFCYRDCEKVRDELVDGVKVKFGEG